MAYASQAGRAKTSSKSPQAHAICDRCAFRYNHVDLNWQYDWAGASLINRRILVCKRCCDTPQEQLRAIVIAADPVPVVNPRTEPFLQNSTDYRQISGFNTVNSATGIPVPGCDTRTTENDDPRVTQSTGAPAPSLNEEPGTDPNAPGDNDPGLPRGFDEVPETGPL